MWMGSVAGTQGLAGRQRHAMHSVWALTERSKHGIRTAKEGLGGQVGVVGLRQLLGHVEELQATQGVALHSSDGWVVTAQVLY